MTEAKNKFAFVESLLTETDFTSEKIARMADVTVAFVEKVRASLSK